MKKTLSVILAVLMLVCCLPFSVFAEETPVSAELYAQTNGYVLDNTHTVYTVGADETFTVPEETTLFIEKDVTLEVYGTLYVQGSVISRGGVLLLKLDTENGTAGKITQPNDGREHVGGNDSKNYRAEVMLSGKNLEEYTVTEHHIANIRYTCSTNGSSYADLSGDVPYASMNINVPLQVYLNQYLFFQMDILDERNSDKKYDANMLTFSYNGAKVKNAQNTYQIYVTTAGVISFAGDKAWKEDTFLKQYKIYIPAGTGYAVYGMNGEASATTETVHLKYGRDFIFRVDIAPDYSRSEYEIYLVNAYQFIASRYAVSLSEMAEDYNDWNDDSFLYTEGKYPCAKLFRNGDGSDGGIYIDENGLCHIPGSFINRDCSIAVTGVVKNETITFAAKIVEMIKNIVNSIREFFLFLGDLF